MPERYQIGPSLPVKVLINISRHQLVSFSRITIVLRVYADCPRLSHTGTAYGEEEVNVDKSSNCALCGEKSLHPPGGSSEDVDNPKIEESQFQQTQKDLLADLFCINNFVTMILLQLIPSLLPPLPGIQMLRLRPLFRIGQSATRVGKKTVLRWQLAEPTVFILIFPSSSVWHNFESIFFPFAAKNVEISVFVLAVYPSPKNIWNFS